MTQQQTPQTTPDALTTARALVVSGNPVSPTALPTLTAAARAPGFDSLTNAVDAKIDAFLCACFGVREWRDGPRPAPSVTPDQQKAIEKAKQALARAVEERDAALAAVELARAALVRKPGDEGAALMGVEAELRRRDEATDRARGQLLDAQLRPQYRRERELIAQQEARRPVRPARAKRR